MIDELSNYTYEGVKIFVETMSIGYGTKYYGPIHITTSHLLIAS